MRQVLAACIALSVSTSAQAGIFITEWMYSGDDGEFVELCNIGGPAVDMTGWSYDDNTQLPGSIDLSIFGIVNPDQCVIISELDALTFNNNWSLGATVAILGGNTENLGRSDEINIYDAGDNLVDRLTFGDQVFAGSIRTQNASGFVSAAGLGANNVFEWTLSSLGDIQNSWAGENGNLGSPGRHVVPEPATVGALSLLAIGLIRRRR